MTDEKVSLYSFSIHVHVNAASVNKIVCGLYTVEGENGPQCISQLRTDKYIVDVWATRLPVFLLQTASFSYLRVCRGNTLPEAERRLVSAAEFLGVPLLVSR